MPTERDRIRPGDDAFLSRHIGRIILLFVLVAGGWVLFSDRLLTALVADEARREPLSVVKGLLSVLVIGGLLYWLIRRLIFHLRRTMKALRVSEGHFHTLFDSSPDGIALVREDGIMMDVNPMLLRMGGFRHEEVIGQSLFELGLFEGETLKAVRERFSHLLEGQPGKPWEIVLHNRRGEPLFVEAYASVIRSGDAPGLMLIIVRDISHRKRSEVALLSSETRYQLLMESAPEAIVLEAEGRFVYANPAALKLFGAGAESELRGQSILERVHPDDRELVRERLHTLHQEHVAQPPHEHRYLRLDGTTIEAEAMIVPFTTPEGERVMAFLRDIGQRKATERIVLAQRDLAVAASQVHDVRGLLGLFLERALSATGLDCGGIYLVDEERGELVLGAHRGLSEDFVRSVERYGRDTPQWRGLMLGLPIYSRFESVERHRTEVQRRAGLKSFAMLPTLHQKKIIACLNLCSRTQEETPMLARVLLEGIASQLGESIVRVRAEQAHRTAESRYREMLEGIQLATVTLDPQGDVAFCNDFLLRTLGRKREELLGRNWFEAGILPATGEKRKEEFRLAVSQEKIPLLSESVLVSRDGQSHRFVWNNAILRDPDGRTVGVAAIGQDVTELEQSREKERHYQNQLVQAEKMAMLGMMASGVAHEINNPNNFIMMNAGIFAQAWEDLTGILERYHAEHGPFSLAGLPYEKARDRMPNLIGGMLDGSRRIQAIVADLKDFAVPENGLVKVPVDLNRTLLSSVKMTRSLLQQAAPRLDVRLADGLPPVSGSSQKLEQVFINLIQNACQALTGPEQTISVYSEVDDGGRRVIVRIADQGRGISAEELKHIFDPFFTTRRKHGGTGLGLPICQRIVADHGGTLVFASQVGTGTTVTVTLPAADVPEGAS